MAEIFKLNLKSKEMRDDPFRYFTSMRERGPLIWCKATMMGKLWVATTYEGVNEVFRNQTEFVRKPESVGRKLPGIFRMMPKSFKALANNMLAEDGGEHRRLRKLVDKAFVRQNVEQMRERISKLACQQIELMESAANSDGSVDLVEGFARPFPLSVICELLGLRQEDRPKFTKWFSSLSNVGSLPGVFKVIPGIRRLQKYLRNEFEICRDNPRPGLISDLVHVSEDGQQLTPDELMSMVFLLLVAGHETTVHLISGGIGTLLENPEQQAELMDDWSLAKGAVNEILRFNSPIQMGKPRFVVRDRELMRQQIKRGQMVMPMIACANYDPDVFEDPDKFDIHRQDARRHQTFGNGPHVCLGMKLALAEAEIALEQLLTRFPNLQRTDQTLDWSPRIGMRSLRSLRVRLV